MPADFQDEIRGEFPLFENKQGPEFPDEVPPELRVFAAQFPVAQRAYDFVSDDDLWKVGLTKEFLALSTNSYERWEDFKGHLEGPTKALMEFYHPSFFKRVGLRYRNVIRRSRLSLSDVPWTELLEGWILGELSKPEFSGRIEGATREVLIKLDEGARVRIRHGLATDKKTEEELYSIDADYFTEQRTEIDDAIPILDTFNRESGRLFRWCITERLHRAMEPNEVA